MEGTNHCKFDDYACGDNAGYIRRIRKHQPTCDICRAAHAEYVRIRRAVKLLEEGENK